MKLIVGLGNPGEEYAFTRHNIGFMVVDHLASELCSGKVSWEKNEKHKSDICKIGEIILVKPFIFMNNSGISVGGLVNFYKIAPSDVWVVHDDIDLPLGKIRIRTRGGSAGHNGVTSIMQHLKSDQFIRFRLGVGRGKETEGKGQNKNIHHRAVIEFVLSRFRQSEAGALKHLVKNAANAVRTTLEEGIEKAMNRFN